MALAWEHAVFDHVAVAAPRIRDLLPIYRDLLGGEFLNGGDNPEVGYRGIQLQYGDSGRVELLEPRAGSSFLDRFLARGCGVHHLTFRVPDFDAALVALVRAGYTPMGESDRFGAQREVFVHPREANGVPIQLVQPGPEYERLTGMVTTLDEVLAGRGPFGNGLPSP